MCPSLWPCGTQRRWPLESVWIYSKQLFTVSSPCTAVKNLPRACTRLDRGRHRHPRDYQRSLGVDSRQGYCRGHVVDALVRDTHDRDVLLFLSDLFGSF